MTVRSNPLSVGEAAPWFRAPALFGDPQYPLDIAGGRVVLMLFFASARIPASADALAKVRARRGLFDDVNASFFGVTMDRSDEAQKRIRPQLPGIRYLLDYDRNVSRQFGALPKDDRLQPHWLLLDRFLRVIAHFPLGDGDAALDALAGLAAAPAAPDWAPAVMVPNVFEPELCRKLINFYEADGGQDSGFMRDVDGVTKLLHDPHMKVRKDYLVEDGDFARQINLRLIHRLNPMIYRAFQFRATRVERLVVACYEAQSGGHFRAHRDNTSTALAYRQFAVTINLNTDEYEGGDLWFPEFGPRTYRAPTGGAIVFSCSLLHQAMPVTKGRRFAMLPFLYDEASEKLREQYAHLLDGEYANSRADPGDKGDGSLAD